MAEGGERGARPLVGSLKLRRYAAAIFAFAHVNVGTAVWFALAPITVPLFFAMYLVAPGGLTSGYVATASYACAIVASYLFLRWRAKQLRSKRKGKCAICGYDLRATPDRCPECGQPVAEARTTSQS
jgi:hypothetical protein